MKDLLLILALLPIGCASCTSGVDDLKVSVAQDGLAITSGAETAKSICPYT